MELTLFSSIFVFSANGTSIYIWFHVLGESGTTETSNPFQSLTEWKFVSLA